MRTLSLIIVATLFTAFGYSLLQAKEVGYAPGVKIQDIELKLVSGKTDAPWEGISVFKDTETNKPFIMYRLSNNDETEHKITKVQPLTETEFTLFANRFKHLAKFTPKHKAEDRSADYGARVLRVVYVTSDGEVQENRNYWFKPLTNPDHVREVRDALEELARKKMPNVNIIYF